MSSPSLKVWLAAFVLFVAGIGVGTAATVFVGARAVRTLANRPTAGNATSSAAERSLTRIQRTLVRDLDLTEAEAKQVKTQLDQTATELRRLRLSTARQARLILRDTVSRVSDTLPSEKRDRFNELVSKRFRRAGLDAEPTGEEKTDRPKN